MSKRTISVGSAEDVYRTGGTPIWECPQDRAYVRHKLSDCGDEWGGLLWREVKRVIKAARLTLPERAAFDHYLKGYNSEESAKRLGLTGGALREYRRRALRKLRACPDIGLLTVIVENCLEYRLD